MDHAGSELADAYTDAHAVAVPRCPLWPAKEHLLVLAFEQFSELAVVLLLWPELVAAGYHEESKDHPPEHCTECACMNPAAVLCMWQVAV